MSLLPYLERVVNRENLPAWDAEGAMSVILRGGASAVQIAAFLVALRMKGESPDELLGFARAMRAQATPVPHGLAGEPLLDTCGTGGDGMDSFNISTVAALVAAGAGVRVVKHGNRSISSRCGSADLLEVLGVNIGMPAERIAAGIRELGFGFLFAPQMHPAMKHAQPARAELKLRSVFNLLGPLTNPAGATAQLVGAPSPWAAELIAKTLACLGLQKGFVVHGSDGMDEITTTGETLVLEIAGGAIAHHTLTPSDFGLKRARPADLRGGGKEQNAAIARSVLEGATGPQRDIVLANTSAALVAAGKARLFAEGVALAAEAIDSGAARRKLDELVRFTNEPAEWPPTGSALR